MIKDELLKKQKLLKKLQKEREALKKKKKNAKKRFDKRKEKLDLEIKEINDSENKILQANSFNLKEILPVIAYLVSLVEDKKYTYGVEKVPVTYCYNPVYKDDYNPVKDNGYYHIAFICTDMKRAKEEINKYSEAILNKYCAYGLVAQLLLKPKNHYTQITFYTDEKDLIFVDNLTNGKEYLCRRSTGYFDDDYYPYYFEGYSQIRDERFLYIIDFMDYLSAMRIQKEDYQLIQEEMMECAKQFAFERKEAIVRERVK